MREPWREVNTNALADDAAARGEPILFLEPSCLSAVREDAPSLLRGDAQRRAQVVADACVTFEEYVERQWQAGSLALHLRAGPSTILLHGHCHQKAMGLAAPSRALLSRIPSATVVELNAGLLRHGGVVPDTRRRTTTCRAGLASACCCRPRAPCSPAPCSPRPACRAVSRCRTLPAPPPFHPAVLLAWPR